MAAESKKRQGFPRLWGAFFGVILVLAGLVAAAVYWRLPLAGWAGREALARAGFENSRLTVSRLDFTGAEIEGLDIENGAVAADAIGVSYTFSQLLQRRVRSIDIAGLELIANVDEAGGVSVAGRALSSDGPSDGGGFELPVEDMALKDGRFTVRTPYGEANLAADGAFNMDRGGDFAVRLAETTAEGEMGSMALAPAEGRLVLEPYGAFTATVSGGGDVRTADVNVAGLAVSVDAAGPDWRRFLQGEALTSPFTADVSVKAPSIKATPAVLSGMGVSGVLDATPQPADPFAASLSQTLAAAIEEAAVDAVFTVERTKDSLSVKAGENGLRFQAKPDIRLVLTDADAPLFSLTTEQRTVAAVYDLVIDGAPSASGALRVDENITEGTARLSTDVTYAAWEAGSAKLYLGTAAFEATRRGAVWNGTSNFDVKADGLSLDGMSVGQARLAGALTGTADLEDKRAAVGLADSDECLSADIKNLRTEIARGTAEGLSVCEKNEAFATFNWADNPFLTLSAIVTGRSARLDTDGFEARGVPPRADADVTYGFADGAWTVTADLTGGDMRLGEDWARAFGVKASVSAAPERIAAALEDVSLTDPAETLRYAPLSASGDILLENGVLTGGGDLFTPGGRRLGYAEVRQDAAANLTEVKLQTEDLAFFPGGLQPQDVVPALKSYIGLVSGGVKGEADIRLENGVMTSSASGALSSFSFAGRLLPEVNDINAALDLSSLMPLATEGVQSLSVGAVNVGAVFEGGEAEYEILDGEVLHIRKAEWPWAGGRIGVYDEKITLGADRIALSLDIKDVDLEEAFGVINVNGLSGEGLVSGAFPVVIENGEMRVENGYMGASQPGALRYAGAASALADSGPDGADLLFQALKDFRFDELSLTVDGPLLGDLAVTTNLKGITPEVYDGAPFDISISVEAPLAQLLKQPNIQDVRDLILQ